MIKLTERACDKQRFISALKHEANAEVPYFETEISPGVVSKILGENITGRSYMLKPKKYIDLCTACGIDLMYVHVPHSPGRREIISPDGRRILVDGKIKSKDDLKLYVEQDTGPVRQRLDELLSAAADTDIGWCYAFGGPAILTAQIGYNDYYALLYEDPGFVHEFLKRWYNSTLPVIETVLSYKPDAAFFSVDLCCKTGMLMSMDMAEEFVLSYLRDLMKPAIKANIPVIMHSDGDNTALMETWIDMGVDALHPVENCGKYNIFEVKKLWGDKMALIGGIDCRLLASGTPEEIRRETKRSIDLLSVGGGYICGSSHDIDDNVSLENLSAMIEAATDS